jgi:hypothetical protein
VHQHVFARRADCMVAVVENILRCSAGLARPLLGDLGDVSGYMALAGPGVSGQSVEEALEPRLKEELELDDADQLTGVQCSAGVQGRLYPCQQPPAIQPFHLPSVPRHCTALHCTALH